MEPNEYETLLSVFPPEKLVEEDDPAYPDSEADSGCLVCAGGQPCQGRIDSDIRDILAAAALPDSEKLAVLQWMIEEGCSSLTRSIHEMAQAFVHRPDKGEEEAQTIAAQNDRFRRLVGLEKPIIFANATIEGIVIFTPGIEMLSPQDQANILRLLREFDAFTADNDPWQEHDFGVIEYQGERIFFKFDYYDRKFEYGSAHPANLAETARVLTVMLAREY